MLRGCCPLTPPGDLRPPGPPAKFLQKLKYKFLDIFNFSGFTPWYRICLNIGSQFNRKYGNLSFLPFLIISNVLQNQHHMYLKNHNDRRNMTKAGNLYIMEFDFTYIRNDCQYQNKNVDT